MYVWGDAQKESIFIFPLNTSLEILLLDDSNNEITKIFLTPHMYVEIDTKKINRLKNADALRVQTLMRMGYITSSIPELYQTRILEAFDIQDSSFFAQAYDTIKMTDASVKNKITSVKQQEILEIF